MSTSTKRSLGIHCLSLAQSVRQWVVRLWETLESAFAISLIRQDTFRQFDTYPFDETDSIDIDLSNADLEKWERDAVDDYFPDSGSVLVVAAGGGRELVSLERLGYDATGVEFGERLHQASEHALRDHESACRIFHALRYELPEIGNALDAAFIARSFLSNVAGRRNRIELLKSIGEQIKPGAPLFVSYYICDKGATFRLQATIANLVRKLIGRGQHVVEVGDHVDPESFLYHHHYADAELVQELKEAGYEVTEQKSTWLGWAVARSVQTADTPKLNSEDHVPVSVCTAD